MEWAGWGDVCRLDLQTRWAKWEMAGGRGAGDGLFPEAEPRPQGSQGSQGI